MDVANEAYDVFISYSRADTRHAAEIDSVVRAKGVRTFFDRRNLAPGLPWVRALEQAIGAAKAAVVLIGPRGLGNTQQYERVNFSSILQNSQRRIGRVTIDRCIT